MQAIISSLVSVLLKSLSKEQFNVVVDGLLDKIEEAVALSPNKFDDNIVLPLVKKTRELLNVPDNDI